MVPQLKQISADMCHLQINAILYYAPSIFQSLGLTGNTVSLLATGVVGIVYVAFAGSRPIFAYTSAACSLPQFPP